VSKLKVDIPRKSIYRLSIYQRCLEKLKENGSETVSSEALAKAAGVKPTQLRKDLTYFGQFGTRGLGYSVEMLFSAINEVLGSNRLQPVILVGVGNLGAALLRYGGFAKEGFELVGAFDLFPREVRGINGSPKIYHYSEMVGFIREYAVKMAILAVPAEGAQGVANEMIEAGIQGILNFSPTVLQVDPEKVQVNNVDLALELENLSYFVH
jgi:redox-sensing transcriptional repressor